jgi:Fe-S cluster biogenesis protein NfuA
VTQLHPPTPTPPAASSLSSGSSQVSGVMAGGGFAGTLTERIAKVIELIRPAVQADGGDIEFVGFTPENLVQIRMHGACVGCPSASVTLQTGIERNLKAHIPEVRGIQAVD